MTDKNKNTPQAVTVKSSKGQSAPRNIYQKIQFIRHELVNLNLKKSGRNTYSNFSYYELGDFLPSLNRLMDENGVFTRFVIQPKRGDNPEKAVLEVINSSNPEERIVFYSETAEVEIGKKKDGTGGADPIQNLGGKITYMRRYLLMIAFEIIESDRVDKKQQDSNGLVLDDESIKKINGANDLDELAQVCKEIKAKKGLKYQKVLLDLYTIRKNEIENSENE